METTGVTFSFVPPYREHIRQLMPSAVQRAIRIRCSEQLSLAPDGTVLARLPESCRLGLNRVVIGEAVATVRASSAIATDLTPHVPLRLTKMALLVMEPPSSGEAPLFLFEHSG